MQKEFFAYLAVAESDITVVTVVDNISKEDTVMYEPFVLIVVESNDGHESAFVGRVGHIAYLERTGTELLFVEREVELQRIERYSEAGRYQVLRGGAAEFHRFGR